MIVFLPTDGVMLLLLALLLLLDVGLNRPDNLLLSVLKGLVEFVPDRILAGFLKFFRTLEKSLIRLLDVLIALGLVEGFLTFIIEL